MSEQSDKVENLQTALTSRNAIDQAAGILMTQQRCDAEAAFDLLRATSQSRNQKLRHIAAQLVASCARQPSERDTPAAQSNGV